MSRTRFDFRTSTVEDQQFLAQMLIEAAVTSGHALTLRDLSETQESYRYVAEWGKPSDLGVLSPTTSTAHPWAHPWARLFDRSNASPAFIDDHTPELTIATVASARGRGLGTALLRQLQDAARGSGIPSLSLGVHCDNQPAQQLYRKEGWTAHTVVGYYNILVKHLN